MKDRNNQDSGLPRNVRAAFVVAALLSAVMLYNEDNILEFIQDKVGSGQTQTPSPTPKLKP